MLCIFPGESTQLIICFLLGSPANRYFAGFGICPKDRPCLQPFSIFRGFPRRNLNGVLLSRGIVRIFEGKECSIRLRGGLSNVNNFTSSVAHSGLVRMIGLFGHEKKPYAPSIKPRMDRPVMGKQASWDASITKKKCMSGNTLFGVTMYQCVLMFLVDAAIIVLPMPSIWKLQMPLKRRFSISALFGLGEPPDEYQ